MEAAQSFLLPLKTMTGSRISELSNLRFSLPLDLDLHYSNDTHGTATISKQHLYKPVIIKPTQTQLSRARDPKHNNTYMYTVRDTSTLATRMYLAALLPYADCIGVRSTR